MTPGRMRIVLTDGGAREGHLFIHSMKPVALKSATGCKVDMVEAIGGQVWRVHLSGRQRGASQQIELSIGG